MVLPLLAAFGFGLVLPASSPAATIHAHRGGPNVEGQAMFGENSMAAFRHSAAAGYVVEFDLGRTSDGVAVAMHDDTLERTTDCAGKVEDRTWAELEPCRIDRLGIGAVRQDLAPGDPRLEGVPSLAQVIELLKQTGARANIEVKNVSATDTEFPDAVYSQLAASGLASSQVIIQNFRANSLANATTIYPGVARSQLSLSLSEELDNLLIDGTAERGIEWVSPSWPITGTFVERAHSAGLKVVPWTIDEATDLTAAAGLGVDAIISNDPTMADRLVGPRPFLDLKLRKNKAKVRPGGGLLIDAVISNAGDGKSDPTWIDAGFNHKIMRPVGRTKRTIGVLEPGAGQTVRVRLKVRSRTKKNGRIPVTVKLGGPDGTIIRKSIGIRIARLNR